MSIRFWSLRSLEFFFARFWMLSFAPPQRAHQLVSIFLRFWFFRSCGLQQYRFAYRGASSEACVTSSLLHFQSAWQALSSCCRNQLAPPSFSLAAYSRSRIEPSCWSEALEFLRIRRSRCSLRSCEVASCRLWRRWCWARGTRAPLSVPPTSWDSLEHVPFQLSLNFFDWRSSMPMFGSSHWVI